VEIKVMQSNVKDEHIQKEVWNGAVPIVLTLNRDEVAIPQTPEPFYFLAPRCGYLPLAVNEAKHHFLPFVPPRVDDPWLEFQGNPVKWHLPTGVLFDLWSSPTELPWALDIHFVNFPAQKVMRVTNDEALKSFYMNSLKEANHLKHGDNVMINNLSRPDQDFLWEGLRSQKYDMFWGVHDKISVTLEKMNYVPVRICRRNEPIIQQPVKALNPDTGEPNTLGEVLRQLLPDVFPAKGGRVLVHGIIPPFETPIAWLAYHCCHPDNFLYIVVLPPE